MAEKKKYKYPGIHVYLDEKTLAKFKAKCKQESRSNSAMAAIIIYNAVKDVVIDGKPKVDMDLNVSQGNKIANQLK